MKDKAENLFGLVWESVIPRDRMVNGDFMNADSDVRIYDEVESIDKLKSIVEEFLVDHVSESKQPMPLVIFSDALEHVSRIARILRQPQGNALLLGVGGSGRSSMTKLATYIAGYQLSMVEIVKGYSMADWKEDIKKVLMLAGVKDRPTTFLFSDVQVSICRHRSPFALFCTFLILIEAVLLYYVNLITAFMFQCYLDYR